MYPFKSISKAVMPSLRAAQVSMAFPKAHSLPNLHAAQAPPVKLSPGNGYTCQKSVLQGQPDSSALIPKAKLPTPCPYPTIYIPNPRQYTKEEYAELALHFENRVKGQWKKVWFGLYQVEGAKESTHAAEIRKLYAGAGMGESLRKPGNQDTTIYFRGYWEFTGLGRLSHVLVESGPTDFWPVIGRLKMYDGIALDNMQFISIMLKEYEKQVDQLSELYQFLEGMQIPHHVEPTEEHIKTVMHGFRERSGNIAQALIDLDLEMGAMQRNINQEAAQLHGSSLERVETLHFRKEVLKP
ncbi:hypothetical protein TSTA_092950 [Talaromyces stipitatus ATCC 10500]|uniref:Uncharacterized protein n=1 Tax=Talaromyces stipitatus (strain ATCC 10500 / CBS 375.48 / QM 6759 / NRRL 1006) TaxID=441959 RepID=B8M373_TALSN|nr:uncharacterized protein TSTA_092950 [Talaromyces stipitatus ATCC 10500]EED22049.1 hypothetical protein TSTA_092950 [Talaromyces stipitatus ATCC 10500]